MNLCDLSKSVSVSAAKRSTQASLSKGRAVKLMMGLFYIQEHLKAVIRACVCVISPQGGHGS